MLFDKARETNNQSSTLELMNHPASFISSQDDYLSKYLKGIDWTEANMNYHFTSNGRFALHDMLIHIASKMDGAGCTVTSFNLSELAAKMFIRAYDKGIFKSLRFALNAQKKSNFADAVKLLEGKFEMIFTNIHAKVGLLWNEKQFITIITTGNLSSNNNIERGIISTAPNIFEYDKNWTDELFEHRNP